MQKRKFLKRLEIEVPYLSLGIELKKKLKKYFPVKIIKVKGTEGKIILWVYRWSGLSTHYNVVQFDQNTPIDVVIGRFWKNYHALSRERGYYGWR